MKKVIAILTFICICLSAGAYAEDASVPSVDLTSMSVAELQALSKSIDGELTNRGLGVVLDSGEYVVGEDIAAGKYVLTETNDDDYDWSTAWRVYVFKTTDSKEEYSRACAEYETAYDLAEKKEEAGESYEYPAELSEMDYFSARYSIASDETTRISLNDGELLMVIRGFAKEGSHLLISQATGLFMN